MKAQNTDKRDSGELRPDSLGGFVGKLRGLGLWNLLWISLALSELFTLIMNTIMSIVVWGYISPELIKIGVVDAFVVSVAVTIILILIFGEFSRSEREAYKAMAEEKAKTEGVIASVGDALCLVDRNFTVRIQNPSHRELVGDAVGKTCHSALLKSDRTCSTCPAIRAMANERIYQSETAVEFDGQNRVFIQKASPVKGPSGEILGAVETLHDITDLREIQEKLQASTNAYKILFNSNPQPLIVYESGSLKILAVNTAAMTQYGYSTDEFLQMTVLDLLHAEDARSVAPSLREGNSGTPERKEGLRYIKKDGSVLDVKVTSHMVPFFNGDAWLMLVDEVTEQ